MSHVESAQTKFYLKKLSPLVGGEIISTVSSPADDYGDEFFGLLVNKNGKKSILWLLADDEGNGPGSFEIQPTI